MHFCANGGFRAKTSVPATIADGRLSTRTQRTDASDGACSRQPGHRRGLTTPPCQPDEQHHRTTPSLRTARFPGRWHVSRQEPTNTVVCSSGPPNGSVEIFNGHGYFGVENLNNWRRACIPWYRRSSNATLYAVCGCVNVPSEAFSPAPRKPCPAWPLFATW